jgi:murein DD-endopeptidase MepM/ murein hydrolase activator NlpD
MLGYHRRQFMRLRTFAAGVALPLAAWGASPLVADAGGPGASAASLSNKIQKVQGKIGAKKGTERVLSTEIAGYSARIDRLQAKITGLRTHESRVQSALDRNRDELIRIQSDLRSERARLLRLRKRLDEARAALAKRLVELYQSDRPDLVTVLLSAKGFADLIERQDFIQRISEQDRSIVTLVRDAKADAIATAHRLDALERRQQTVTARILERRQEITSVKQELIGTRVGYAGTRADKQNALSHVRVERTQLEGNLSDLRAQQAKITRTLQSSQGSLPAGPIKRGGGTLIWPVNGPITSPFCESRAWESCHPGIDIGVPSGTPIRAAAAGTVSLIQSEAQSGGYGNFTCVQHSGALATCYAHQSAFRVSLGQHVGQGQIIGLTGCTGRCFGPHLHFEVRVNGAVTNPLDYL